MKTLYEWPPTRSNRVKWALEELGTEYEGRPVKLLEGEQDTEAYRKIHPLGCVPVLADGDYRIFESVAICLQLIDEHPKSALAPAPGSPARAEYYQWCVFAAAEVDPALMLYFDNAMRPLEGMRPPGSQHDPNIAERGRREFAERAVVLSAALENREYLIGDTFSGADIVVGHSCFMAQFMDLLKDHPVLENYYGKLCQRPAHKRVYGGP